MQELWLIGIGTGNPDHLTFAGAKAMREAGVILIPRKGDNKSDLADLRRLICDQVLGNDAPEIIEFDLPVRDPDLPYFQAVDLWHDAIADAWRAAAGPATRVAMLVWGDPSLYDSSLRIASRLNPMPTIRVEPGITALQALTAGHAIPINEIGQPFIVTTGRQLREQGWPKGADTAAFMLDGSCSFQHLRGEGYHIWWGAFLGMEHQLLISGPLHEVSDTIIQTRAEARARHGWIMDIYLIRRS
jgi:precorrin-6A synthase